MCLCTGVITKPDLIDAGAEQDLINVASNLHYPLKLGYVTVRCRSQLDVTNEKSLQDAVNDEQAFFEANNHFRFDFKHVILYI